MTTERTFIALKPDGVRRGLIGEIISRFERRGYVLVALKMMMPTMKLLEEHYAEHAGKPFIQNLLKVMSEGPVVIMIWEGEDIISQARKMIGATRPSEAAPGTIRSDFAQIGMRNLIHGSDTVESAEREIQIWFRKEEILSYKSASNEYLFCN